jgi:hypothetical protein
MTLHILAGFGRIVAGFKLTRFRLRAIMRAARNMRRKWHPC